MAFVIDKEFKRITYYADKPLFSGSLEDVLISWTDEQGKPMSRQPACLLPFGGFIENDELVMSLGVNDAFNGIFGGNEMQTTKESNYMPFIIAAGALGGLFILGRKL